MCVRLFSIFESVQCFCISFETVCSPSIPGYDSNYATCLPNLAGFVDDKPDMLHSWKIKLSTNWCSAHEGMISQSIQITEDPATLMPCESHQSVKLTPFRRIHAFRRIHRPASSCGACMRFFVPGKRNGAEYMREAFKAWLGRGHAG